jgi:hypothetical protein
VTELEILRRRRGLVLLSAELQRATVVRRLEHVARHPGHAVVGLVARAATVPILLKVGSALLARIGRRRATGIAPKSRFSVPGFLKAFRLLPVMKFFPVLKSLNR